MTDNRDDADEEIAGSPKDESPLTPDETVGQFTITVNQRDWQRYEYHSLRTRIQNELRETQEIWPSSRFSA